MQPADELDAETVVRGVDDDEWARGHSSGLPFHTHVSYMLVSMECLLGSPYLRAVEDAGLAGEHRPSMGRRDARYRDEKIGEMSAWAQRWVDRNFSLDYTLKSLEKVTRLDEYRAIRGMRYRVRAQAYRVLGDFLSQYESWSGTDGLRAACERLFAELVDELDGSLDQVRGCVEAGRMAVLEREISRWSEREEWGLING